MTNTQALFSFDGRINRLAYFGYSVLIFTITFFTYFMLFESMHQAELNGDTTPVVFTGLLAAGATIAFIWSGLALSCKRLHDLGMPGTYLIGIYVINFGAGITSVSAPGLSAILQIVNLGISLYLLFAPGETGTNQYGENPLNRTVLV